MPAIKKKRGTNKTFGRIVLPGVLLLCSLVLTIVAWYISRRNLAEKTTFRFEYEAGTIQSAIQARMTDYEQVLRSAVGFFYSSDTVTRSDWKEYVQTLRVHAYYPGIQGLGYTTRLFPQEVEGFTKKVRAEGFPHFRVWPGEPRDEFHSIVYLEPFTGRNLRAFGYDMFTEEKRRQAMQRAMDTGEPALSPMVTLVQETGRDVQKGCLLYLPVYNRKMGFATVEERRASLRGFVYSPFRINDLMMGILDSVAPQVAFAIYDGKGADTARLFYASPGYREQKGKAAYSVTRPVTVAGHDWTLVFTASPHFAAAYEDNLPHVIAIAGVLVNLLLLFILVKINLLSSRNRVLAERYKAEKDRYEIVSLSTDDIIWEWDLAENTVRCNQNVETVLGYSHPATPLTYAEWMDRIHPGDRDRVAGKMKAFLREKNAFWSEEYRLLKADGSSIDILDRGRLVYDVAGTPVRMVGSMINITERKRAEEAQRRFNEELERTVQARTLELQRSNEDLERFAHVASHDLKEPVRKMRTKIDLLKTKYQSRLGDDLPLLDRLAKSATRLNQMIESILAYSTVRYEAQGAEQVDLDGIIRNVCDDLELVIAEKGAKIIAEPLPQIEGSSVLLHQLFYNLVNNALKFSRAGVAPVLTIEAQCVPAGAGEVVEIRLADNGIGFSQDEAEKIFQSFVRLYPKDRYEGTGLGLALCKRIVARHGGTIRAEGSPGEGAVFILRFPKKQQGGTI
ncbi:MAG TPA: CHASE domain-containing protein [Flavisolibacter sp.]|nr:CHASE domain-containing protein [Flavisolibacter sp.]